MHLLKHEIALELRQKYAIGGVLLYVVSTIFVCYLSFHKIIDISTWNGLLWIILLFAATNGLYKSFHQDTSGRQLYLYTLVKPQQILVARMLYNILLMLILSGLTLLIYVMLIGNEVLAGANHSLFAVSIVMGAFGFAALFTMVSAIASRAGRNAGMMAILGFPIILPMLLSIMKVSRQALLGLEWSMAWKSMLILAAINVLVIALAYILFPYLWRD